MWVFCDLHTIQGNNRIENFKTTCDQEMTGQNHKVQGTTALRISPPPVHKFKDWHNNQRYASSSKYHRVSMYKSCMAALPLQRNNYFKSLHTKNKSRFEANKRISAFHLCIMKDSLISCDLSGDAFRPHSHQQFFFSITMWFSAIYTSNSKMTNQFFYG